MTAFAKQHSAAPGERRQFGRRAVVRNAWISGGTGQRVACSIRDISEGGALIEIPEGAVLGSRFTLVLAEGSASALCETRHRSGSNIGARFINAQEGARFNALLAGTSAPMPKPAAPAASDAATTHRHAPAVIHLGSLPPVI